MKNLARFLALLLQRALGDVAWSSDKLSTVSINIQPAENLFSDRNVVFGVYDPHSVFVRDSAVGIGRCLLWRRPRILRDVRTKIQSSGPFQQAGHHRGAGRVG
jgi:hypothetical protein